MMPTMDDNRARLTEVNKEIRSKLDAIKRDAEHSLLKGYDFGNPNSALFINIIQLEAERRTLNYVLSGQSVVMRDGV